MFNIYVEKKDRNVNGGLIKDFKEFLNIECESVRKVLRYTVDGIDEKTLERAIPIFAEAPVDNYGFQLKIGKEEDLIVVEYLDGQFDQRADSASQCIKILTGGTDAPVRCATLYLISGVTAEEKEKIKKYLINPVECREGREPPVDPFCVTAKAPSVMREEEAGFIEMGESELRDYYDAQGFAMSYEDCRFVQEYFRKEGREPTRTEIKVIDTYWSDHCRHTTFLTHIKSVKILSNIKAVEQAYRLYREKFAQMYKGRENKYECLMDMATLAAKVLSEEGYLDNLDRSDEINACSVTVKVDVDGKDEDWLIMFKNETHNHPTEIEPFGGAATCLGGAIRDPLSGRSYVYQAMRITGAADPTTPFDKTLNGKLPQRVLCRTALAGFSSYGNQIGLATGTVHELYHKRYVAKRLETGYVIGGAPKENVIRKTPKAGDIVLLLGGDTGRDGCGGATGSSKSHTVESVSECGAEVQKGNAPEERKLQRLFRNPEASKLIIRCNDFGAGGVSVAIGELSDGLDIRLEKVHKKYEGLNATELAISESQERMAVVVEPENAERFKELASAENLKCYEVASVTDSGRLRMYYKDETVVDIARSFLDTNGVRQETEVVICDEYKGFFEHIDEKEKQCISDGDIKSVIKNRLKDLNVCSQKGAGETFDGTIGASTVLMPFGGKNQLTPSMIMASKPPVRGSTSTVTCSSFGAFPALMCQSPFLGSYYAVVTAVHKLLASGVKRDTIRLTLQEFFKKLRSDPQRWGEPASALLGAFAAQLLLKTGAIGGKDSMSGSFEDLDVPPTLIAFAMGVLKEDKLIDNTFRDEGYVYLYPIKKDETGVPDEKALLETEDEISSLTEEGKVLSACVVEEGGRLVTLIKSLMGNDMGLKIAEVSGSDFCPAYGDIIILTKDKLSDREVYAEVTKNGIVEIGGTKINMEELKEAFKSTLENVFPTTAKAEGYIQPCDYEVSGPYKAEKRVALPKVLIPVFPGTNCEYDSGRAFEKQGFKTDIFVVKNITAQDIEYTVKELVRRINDANVIMLPGGFSCGDEPDGSGKFIATTFSNPYIAEAVMDLLKKRDGLILGICNGFQALIKLGLVPNGQVMPLSAESPTLTYNNIGRHVSTIVKIRVASNKSPWLNKCKPGEIYSVPVSHGEGKFIADEKVMSELIRKGQIATQYADESGEPTMLSPFNPNGSYNAVEGILSEDGRIFGKMGHTERRNNGLYRNVDGNYDMPLFSSAAEYYK